MAIKGRNKPSADFSVASFADIVFMLLIFFMLTSQFVAQSSLKVDLPKSESQTPSQGNNTISIAADNRFAWNDKVIEKGEIPARIEAVLTDASEENDVITIRVDKEVKMEEAAFVMANVAKFGGTIFIATEKE